MVCTLINDKNDVKIFETKGTTPALGEWFHCKVPIKHPNRHIVLGQQ